MNLAPEAQAPARPEAALRQTPAADWSREPERSNRAMLRIMCWIATACGRRAARAVLHPIALYFLLRASGPRRHAQAYLRRALGRSVDWRDGYRLVHAFAATVLDRVYFLRDRMDLFDIRVHGATDLHAALAAGRGAFLVGAHAGSFEAVGASARKAPSAPGNAAATSAGPDADAGAGIGRAIAPDSSDLRIAMLMYPDNARRINAALDAVASPALRDRLPRVIALGRSGSMLALREWLDTGGLAGMLADRTLPGESGRAGRVVVDFLGTPAAFNDGPFRLAALLGREVLFMAGIYAGGNRYDVRFEPLADFRKRDADPAVREAAIRAAVAAYAARLETLCREHPYNWFNFHDFWCDGPGADPVRGPDDDRGAAPPA